MSGKMIASCKDMRLLFFLAFASMFIDWNLLMMRVFRNISRVRANKRRFENRLAVALRDAPSNLATFFELDAPLNVEDLSADGIVFTEEELGEFCGVSDDQPIYLAIADRVYDVSHSRKRYGPNGTYKNFAGRNITYALATGCLKDACIGTVPTALTPRQKLDLNRWVEFFEYNDRYVHVGTLSPQSS